MRQAKTIVPQALIRGDRASTGTRALPGTMVMFVYDPKLRDKLPYYDMFPLVLPFAARKGGFLGLNMHYLNYHMRAQLLDRLLAFKTNTSFDENTRLKFNWALIGHAAKFAAAKPCVKHYLYQHVETPFKAIHSEDWATALMLPVEHFAKSSSQEVWKQSQRIIRNS
jgi:hypothetical protein